MKQHSPKVALIQNRLQPGGRFQVMAEMIRVLNRHGIRPCIITFRFRLTAEKIRSYYGQNLDFELRLLKPEPPLPFEWNITWFNRRVSRELQDFDLVINHNNTSFGLNTSTPVLSYVHFPRKYRLATGLQDMHRPEAGRLNWLNYRQDLFNLMARYYRRDVSFNPAEQLLANSDYTRACLLEAYPELAPDEVAVLYPPVKLPAALAPPGTKNQMVSLGRIAPQKRQLEQIELAARVPGVKLVIIGFVADEQYYRQCRERIVALAADRIRIIANAEQAVIDEELAQSRFFIHAMRNEPFGITPVQAIAKGCLPLVHNSGGQREVVIDEDLRYEDMDQAVGKLQELLAADSGRLTDKLQALQKHIKKFGTEQFSAQFEQKLISLLP